MNKDFQRIPEEKTLFFDLEVVRRSKQLELDSTEYSLYQKKTRDRDTDEFLTDQELVEHYDKWAALKMGYNKIVTIGVGYIKDGVAYIKDITGEEKEVIEEFCTIANQFEYLCGANVLAFDCPVLLNNGWRYFNMTEKIKDDFITSGKKPWGMPKITDLMETFKGTHYYNSSVEEICYHFNIPTPKDDISGADVSRVYYEEGVDRISKYVKKDVLANINIFRRMRGQDIFEDFVDRSGTKTETKKIDILKNIYINNQITADNKKELKELFGKKKLSKKEKEILVDMLHKLSIESDVFKKDSKDVLEEKLKTAQEIINKL